MKIQLSKILMLCFLFATANAHSEVYSWVDKDGKKHFGEAVPKEYQKQSKAIDVKPVNSMQATDITNAPQQPNKQSTPVFVSPQNDNSQNTNSCEQRKRAYENSVMCFARCRNNGEGGTRVNNVSGCSKCQDLKKPDC